MARIERRWFMITVMLVLLVSPAWGASISGTVTNGTGKSGRIYLAVDYQNGGSSNLGTSIASTVSGSFTINGVTPGTQCSVRAFLDTVGNGMRHANDPAGVSTTVTAGSGNTSVGSFAVTTPAATAAQAPQVMVFPGNGGNFVMWDGGTTPDGISIADRFTVEWSTSSGGTPLGSRVVPSGDMDFFAHAGGLASYYYRITAHAGASTALSSWTQGAASTATGSVTGKVLFPGVTPTGPLFVALANETHDPPQIHLVTVASPTSGGSYSASKVPPGTYTIYPILDQNQNGFIDIGDLGPSGNDDFSTKVTVASGPVSAADVSLIAENAATLVTTSHGKYSSGGEEYQWYNLQFSAQSMLKQVVKVQVGSGPQITGPIDVALDGTEFRAWLNVNRPTVGDSYPITLTYSDDSVQEVTRSVTGVLDGFPTSLAPVGYVAYNPTPTFSWSAPNPAPAEYIQSIWMQQTNPFMNAWDAWGIPAGTTSMVYGAQGEVSQQTLTDGATYNWTLNIRDRNGNEAQSQANFTPTTSPALSGFTPAGGLSGTTVTLSGINFSTTPGQNAVTFNNVPATVTQASSTSLTVTVPAGATSGPIKVTTGGKSATSEGQFIVAAPVNVRGVIRTTAEAPIAGARVELADNAAIFATTAADGSFTLQPLFPGQDFALKVTRSGYVTTYSTRFFLDAGNLDLTPYPFHLYTQAELTSWGIAAGKGAIFGRVFNTSSAPFTPVAGAQVSATSSAAFGAPVPVTYFSGTSFGGSSTYANGLFFIANVGDFDAIRVDAAKAGWNFFSSYFEVRAGSVTEGGVVGNFPFPSLGGFTPATGKAGTSVTISGVSFSSTPAENVVKFNGSAATVTSTSPSTLIVTVPAAATTGPISVTTPGGTVTFGSDFTMRHTLTVSVSGTNGALGTVTSAPVGISCRGAGCSAEFDQGTALQLGATADGGSRFGAWSGACSGSSTPCSLSMSADRTVAASFEKLLYIKNGTTYYSLLQEAFDGAADGSTIQVQAQSFVDTSLLFNKPGLQVKFKGGYDPSFGSNGGFTILDGRLNLRGGQLRVEKLKIR